MSRLSGILSGLTLLLIIPQMISAQKIEGVYRLSGGQEMVAAFKFKKDSSFEFYFAYGAVDRQSSGKFVVKDGNIFLHPEKIPGKDFTIVKKEKTGDGTTVKIIDNNPALVRNVMGIFKKDTTIEEQYSDENGIIHSNLRDCDSIYIIHTLFPDVPTEIQESKINPHNYFELSLNPSLAFVSFTGFILKINGNRLSGSLSYLFERETVVFVKETE